MKRVTVRREIAGKMRDVTHVTIDAEERREVHAAARARGDVLVFTKALPSGGLSWIWRKREGLRETSSPLGDVVIDGLRVEAWSLLECEEAIRARVQGGPPPAAPANVESWEAL
jgi:hypothetical protein